MSRRVYKISVQALKDLENIWLFTLENWSLAQADRYTNLIFDEFEYLTNDPSAGINFGHIRQNYYYSKVKSHLIFYKNVESKNQIEIIRILHERMDIETRLEE